MITLLDKLYDGESIVDVGRDVEESFSGRFTPAANDIPSDEYGISTGSFKVTITWTPDE